MRTNTAFISLETKLIKDVIAIKNVNRIPAFEK
jgi:hypothetical protein